MDRVISTWRTPLVILLCGCLIGVLGFGPRSGLGFFLTPMSQANGWGRDVFALALAIQMLLWGAAQPVAGALADRYGPVRVLSVGALLYAFGLAAMAYSTTPLMIHLTAGVAILGFGLAGASFTIVIGAFGRLMPEKWRTLSFGAGTAAGSFGQFLFSPLSVAFIDGFGWQRALFVLAAFALLIAPLSLALANPRGQTAPAAGAPRQQSLKAALSEAFGYGSYVLLVLGFFTCGFQVFFISVHLPAYLIDRGLPAEVGGWTLAVIGLFNIFGAIFAGWLSARIPKRYILAFIYFGRAVAILVYIMLPPNAVTTLIFGAVLGLLWLSTVPPTSGLIAVMFGTRWLATLFGLAFFSHQVGGFLGVWLGGVLFETTGSYDVVWWLAILFGVLSALINLPIVERPAPRLATAPA